jgi:hypothetical protein
MRINLEPTHPGERHLTMHLIRACSVVLCLLFLIAAPRPTLAADTADVEVSVDSTSYAPGAAITATADNYTSVAVSPTGGIVCQDSPWPFTFQILDDAGNWHDVQVPRTQACVGIAAALLPPGASTNKTLAAPADAGEYRLVYTFHATDGTDGVAASDPFTVTS